MFVYLKWTPLKVIWWYWVKVDSINFLLICLLAKIGKNIIVTIYIYIYIYNLKKVSVIHKQTY